MENNKKVKPLIPAKNNRVVKKEEKSCSKRLEKIYTFGKTKVKVSNIDKI